MSLTFRWLEEAQPGPKWAALAARTSEAYRSWYTAEGEQARPELSTCRRQLTRHMPELVPVWEQLVELGGGDPLFARLLSLWRPPAYLAGCSQAVWTRGEPMLVRNYDYAPSASESTFLLSSWTGPRVLVASDCLWGALDGMNEHGLAVALAYGGHRVRGDGFGIPLVLRYLLETCRGTEEALQVLRRVPSHMAYNVSVVDAQGRYAVAQLGPDQKTRVLHAALATNHQGELRWPLDDQGARSLQRARYIERMLSDSSIAAAQFSDAFLAAPLYVDEHTRGAGTLYTAVYHPRSGCAEYRWPGQDVHQGLDAFEEREVTIRYASPG